MLKAVVLRKAAMMVIVAAAGSAGTWALTALPEVHAAFCGVR